MLRFFFRKPDTRVDALYGKAVAQARTPIIYQRFGVADTLDGRFDLLVLHLTPLIAGLRGANGALAEEGQALFDTFVKDMEGNLRSIGVGDQVVPKKMRAIGEAFYGRFHAYRGAAGDAELAGAIARNVLGDEGRSAEPEAKALVRYYHAVVDAVARRSPLDPAFAFPDPAPFAPAPVAAAS